MQLLKVSFVLKLLLQQAKLAIIQMLQYSHDMLTILTEVLHFIYTYVHFIVKWTTNTALPYASKGTNHALYY